MVTREVDQAGDEAPERVGAQEEAHRAPVGHGEHAHRRLVQPLLRGAEQLLAGQAGDHFQHLLARVGLEGETGAVDGATHPTLHHRDVQNALVQRGHGEAAEEAVLTGAAALAVEGGDGEVEGVHGLERARRVGAGDHQGFATAPGLVGDGADLGAAAAVAEHAEAGRDVRLQGAVRPGDVVAVAEEREVSVDEPAQQRRDVGLGGAAGGGGPAGERIGDLAGARPHRLGVRDDLAHVAQHAGELRFQLVGRHGQRGQLEARPRLGERVGRRCVGVGAGEDLGELAVGRAAHHDDGVQHPAHLPARARDGGEQGGDEERHVVGDRLDDQAAVGRGLDPDHQLARGAVLGQRQMGPRGDLQLAPAPAQRTDEVRRVARVERGERGQVGIGWARHMKLRDRRRSSRCGDAPP